MLTSSQSLSSELSDLGQEERRLDELIQSCTLDVQQMTEASHSHKYPYYTHTVNHTVLTGKQEEQASLRRIL